MTKEESKKIAKIVVDRDLCIGAATCIALAPELFELDDENKAVLQDGWREKGMSDEQLMEAAQSCPVDAVLLYDKDDNQLYP